MLCPTSFCFLSLWVKSSQLQPGLGANTFAWHCICFFLGRKSSLSERNILSWRYSNVVAVSKSVRDSGQYQSFPRVPWNQTIKELSDGRWMNVWYRRVFRESVSVIFMVVRLSSLQMHIFGLLLSQSFTSDVCGNSALQTGTDWTTSDSTFKRNQRQTSENSISHNALHCSCLCDHCSCLETLPYISERCK